MVSVHRRMRNNASMTFLFCVISRFPAMLQAPFGNNHLRVINKVLQNTSVYMSHFSKWIYASYRLVRPIYGKNFVGVAYIQLRSIVRKLR